MYSKSEILKMNRAKNNQTYKGTKEQYTQTRSMPMRASLKLICIYDALKMKSLSTHNGPSGGLCTL